MQRPSHGPFAILGTAAALGVGARVIKKSRPFQCYNGLAPLTSKFLPACVSVATVHSVSAHSSSTTRCWNPFCVKCNPPFWNEWNSTELVLLVLFFGGVVTGGQIALASNIELRKIAAITAAAGSAMYGTASKLFGIERETASSGVNLDRLETSHGKLRTDLKEFKAELKTDLSYYFVASAVLFSALILLKR